MIQSLAHGDGLCALMVRGTLVVLSCRCALLLLRPLQVYLERGVSCHPSNGASAQLDQHSCLFRCVPLQGGFPELRVMLCIGGIDMRTQMDTLRKGGPPYTHIAVSLHRAACQQCPSHSCSLDWHVIPSCTAEQTSQCVLLYRTVV
jgi:hypothetical protein